MLYLRLFGYNSHHKDNTMGLFTDFDFVIDFVFVSWIFSGFSKFAYQLQWLAV